MTMEKGKIFVGGLSWDTTKDALKSYFLQYGEVTDCIVMSNPQTGKSRGFGFVTFRDPSVVDVLLTTPKHTIDGRTVDAKACSARGSGGSVAAGEGAGRASGRNSAGYTGRTTKMFIGGLPNDASDDTLKDCFSRFGQVLEVVIMYDQEKSRPRGFGFLTLDSEDAVEAAVKEHYVDFNGKKIECKRAEPRQGGGARGGKQVQVGAYNGYSSGEQTWGGMGDGANWNQYGYGQQQAYGAYGQQQSYDPNWGQQGPGYAQGWSQQSYGQQQSWAGPQPTSAGQGTGYGGYSGPGFSNNSSHPGYAGSNDEYGAGLPPAGKPGSAGGYHPYKR